MDELLQETHSSIDRVREPSPYVSGLLEKVLGFTTFATEGGTLAQIIAANPDRFDIVDVPQSVLDTVYPAMKVAINPDNIANIF